MTVEEAPAGLPEFAGAPPATVAGRAQRLAQLDRIAEQYVRAQRPENTLRAYAADWKAWQDYTAQAGIPLFSGTPGALVGFVWWLETMRGAAPATVDRRLTGAIVGLREHAVVVDPLAGRAARQALAGYRRRLAEAGVTLGRGEAHPVTVADLRTLSRACPQTPAGYRDRAMILVGFAMAARCSDLANLAATDLVLTPGLGLLVTVRHGKSIGESPIRPGAHAGTCPVRAWRSWVDESGVAGGPAFRRIDRHGLLSPLGLRPQGVDRVLVRAGERAGLPFRLTGHSLRAGLATEARRSGARDDQVADQGRWQRGSRALQRYFRRVDRWTDNALRDLGL